MSKVLQPVRARRLPSVGTVSVSAIPVQQAEPVVIDMTDESADELVDENGDPTQAMPTEHPGVDAAPSAPPSAISRFKRFCRRLYRKFGMKHMITLFMVIIYTIIGAAAFLHLEKAHDEKRLEDEYAAYELGRREFARNLSDYVRANPTSIDNVTDLERFIEEYDEKRALKPSTDSVWNFWHAMYFAGTIYTTIGYGDIFCRTTSGRILTIFYSLIGIPLMLITLTDLGGLLLKLMFGITHFCDACKARFSPAALFGPHPPGYDAKPAKYKSVLAELGETGTTDNATSEKPKADGDDDDNLDLYEMERQEDEDYEYQLMRVPVLTALGTTIGWIFLCAGLFCIWEDWDYFTSVYFFFVSLSTIGLGDVTPDRKDIMVATYFFVIVGLSLVSMCITVIQRRLEDLYLQLLQMILQEYHRQLMENGDQVGATVGMMQAWQKSKKARFLMPLLSKDKKKTVAKRFQDEAKAQGIVLPAVLRDLNPTSGLPAVLHVAKTANAQQPAQVQEAVGEAMQRAAAKARALNEPIDEDFGVQAVCVPQPEVKEHPGKTVTVIPAAPPPMPVSYDADVQTDELEVEDKQEQTSAVPITDAQTQSLDSSFASNLRVDEASQTPVVELDDASTQCKLEEPVEPPPQKPPAAEMEDKQEQTMAVPLMDAQTQSLDSSLARNDAVAETQTDALEVAESSSQTSKVANKEQLVQTHLYDLSVSETQTERVETKNQRLQTPVPDYLDHGAQTDPLVLDPEQFQATGTLSMRDHGTGWAKAKRNLKKAIDRMQPSASKGKLPSYGIPTVPSLSGIEPTPAMASWNDVVGEHDEDGPAGFTGTVEFVGGAEEDEEEEEEEEEQPGQLSRRESEESLHWDPIDGLHAEPKRNVRDLKKMFEKPTPQLKHKDSGRRSFRRAK